MQYFVESALNIHTFLKMLPVQDNVVEVCNVANTMKNPNYKKLKYSLQIDSTSSKIICTVVNVKN